MASKCIIDSKLTDNSELAGGYTYHCDRRSVTCVSPILGAGTWGYTVDMHIAASVFSDICIPLLKQALMHSDLLPFIFWIG